MTTWLLPHSHVALGLELISGSTECEAVIHFFRLRLIPAYSSPAESCSKRRPTSEQGAGLGGSERIITGWDPDQERVLGGILQTEVPELSGGLGHLQSHTYDKGRA